MLRITAFFKRRAELGRGDALERWQRDYFGERAFRATGGTGDYTQACVTGPTPALADICAAASASGLRYGLISIAVFLLWASLHFYFASRTIRTRFGVTTE